jgi:excisionase family DNA binding protein
VRRGTGTESISLAPEIIFERLLDDLAERVALKLERRIPPRKNDAALKRLLTVEEAAQYLGRTKAAIQHLIAARVLPVVKSDRRVFLDLMDLDAWIEKHKEGL